MYMILLKVKILLFINEWYILDITFEFKLSDFFPLFWFHFVSSVCLDAWCWVYKLSLDVLLYENVFNFIP